MLSVQLPFLLQLNHSFFGPSGHNLGILGRCDRWCRLRRILANPSYSAGPLDNIDSVAQGSDIRVLESTPEDNSTRNLFVISRPDGAAVRMRWRRLSTEEVWDYGFA
jgi:hypothetical protein